MIPEKGYKHMLDPAILNASSLAIIGEKIFQRWGACEPVSPHLASSVAPFTMIDLGHSEIQYIPAPGHAPHHHILKLEPSSIVFAADSMGIIDNENNALIPTTPPPSFDFEKAIQDISAVEKLAPKLACIAHFQELEANSSLFARIKNTYEKWLARTNELVGRKSMASYDLNVCEELFAILVKDFPEYARISSDLREQAIRIDCAGMLNCSLRNQRS
jgi:glyoxylase-like metal-dependent hydrolase (beta-lactamase superfamily II)